MTDLILEASEETPFVHFDLMNQNLEIFGESRPEDPNAFYEPIIQKITEFVESKPQGPVSIQLKFTYFNSASAKYLYDLIAEFESLKDQVTVNWFSEASDDSIADAVELFSDSIDLKFVHHTI